MLEHLHDGVDQIRLSHKHQENAHCSRGEFHRPRICICRKEATDEADDQSYFAVLDQAGNAAEAAAAEITGYKTYADLLEALDTRRKQS